EQIASPYITVGKSGGATQSTTSTGGSTTTSTTTTTTVSASFMTGSATGDLPINDTLTGSFASYICAGAINLYAYGPIAPNYSVDAEDASTNTTAIGRNTAFCGLNQVLNCRISACKIPPTGALATIGLTKAPVPVINKQALIPPEDGSPTTGSINYTLSNSNSFVVITAACGDYFNYGLTCSVTWPSGCTQRRAATDSNGDEAFLATCQSQAPGTYYADISANILCKLPQKGFFLPLGACGPMSMAVYAYPNYSPTGS
ncbi:MAG: hypothetical protein LVQ95_05560, partial [Candidatus Micrarchaeales archaeon]|nr:hypothetical protein [Candidatus Micrarchaeales archaeon]